MLPNKLLQQDALTRAAEERRYLPKRGSTLNQKGSTIMGYRIQTVLALSLTALMFGCGSPGGSSLNGSNSLELAVISKSDPGSGTETIRVFVLDADSGVIHSGTTDNSGNIHSFQWDFKTSVPTP